MWGRDNQWHSLETEATSLFTAAYAGISEWNRFEWYRPDEMIEVRSGEQRWYVRARRVSAWNAERIRNRSR